MSFLVTDACVKCKYTDCIEVCPVDCFYEGEHFVVIDPDQCIDCGVCEPECPVSAIVPESDDDPSGKWRRINGSLAKVWPNITSKRAPPADAADYVEMKGKFERFVGTELEEAG